MTTWRPSLERAPSQTQGRALMKQGRFQAAEEAFAKACAGAGALRSSSSPAGHAPCTAGLEWDAASIGLSTRLFLAKAVWCQEQPARALGVAEDLCESAVQVGLAPASGLMGEICSVTARLCRELLAPASAAVPVHTPPVRARWRRVGAAACQRMCGWRANDARDRATFHELEAQIHELCCACAPPPPAPSPVEGAHAAAGKAPEAAGQCGCLCGAVQAARAAQQQCVVAAGASPGAGRLPPLQQRRRAHLRRLQELLGEVDHRAEAAERQSAAAARARKREKASRHGKRWREKRAVVLDARLAQLEGQVAARLHIARGLCTAGDSDAPGGGGGGGAGGAETCPPCHPRGNNDTAAAAAAGARLDVGAGRIAWGRVPEALRPGSSGEGGLHHDPGRVERKRWQLESLYVVLARVVRLHTPRTHASTPGGGGGPLLHVVDFGSGTGEDHAARRR